MGEVKRRLFLSRLFCAVGGGRLFPFGRTACLHIVLQLYELLRHDDAADDDGAGNRATQHGRCCTSCNGAQSAGLACFGLYAIRENGSCYISQHAFSLSCSLYTPAEEAPPPQTPSFPLTSS